MVLLYHTGVQYYYTTKYKYVKGLREFFSNILFFVPAKGIFLCLRDLVYILLEVLFDRRQLRLELVALISGEQRSHEAIAYLVTHGGVADIDDAVVRDKLEHLLGIVVAAVLSLKSYLIVRGNDAVGGFTVESLEHRAGEVEIGVGHRNDAAPVVRDAGVISVLLLVVFRVRKDTEIGLHITQHADVEERNIHS